MEIPERVLQNANQEGIVERDKRLYLRAWKGKGLKDILRAKCIDCCGFEDVRNRVFECSIDICPIHRVRKRMFDFSSRDKRGVESLHERLEEEHDKHFFPDL